MNKDTMLDLIRDFIESRNQMVIGTYGDEPWIATLYYASDDDLNLYFLTNPETIHGKHIHQNQKVSVAIADSPQTPSSKKKGIQLYGNAQKIEEKEAVVDALSMWKHKLKVTSDEYTYESMMSNTINGRMYQVVPKKIKFFNQEIWEEGEEPVIEL